MHVLLVGSNQPGAIENYYASHLNESGGQATIFACNKYYNPSALINRILLRLNNTSMFTRVNTALLARCSQEKPDIVWVFKGVEIYKTTLLAIRKLGIKLINYNPDHPFIRTTVSHGGNAIAASVPLYDAHFCYSHALRNIIEGEYGIKTFLLPFAYEPSALHASDETASADILRVAMVGHADRKRAKVIKTLLANGIECDLYGPHWRRYLVPTKGCRLYPTVLGLAFWDVMLRYRVQLNIFRPHNEGSHNMRSFEIPSVGGIQLAPWSEEHEIYFENGKEIWLYRDEDELIHQAKVLLAMPKEEAMVCRTAAKNRCIRDNHTYASRALWVKRCMEDLLTKPIHDR